MNKKRFKIPTPTPAPDHPLVGHNELNGRGVSVLLDLDPVSEKAKLL